MNMKIFFKKPDDVKKIEPKAMTKALGKAMKAPIEGTQFFYKCDFEYAKSEIAPMLFIGPPSGEWKKFVKSNKKSPDFAAGYCKTEADETTGETKKLLLQVTMGKGDKPPFLKKINKELLKKLSIEAEFVEELDVENVYDDEKEDIHEDEDIHTIEKTKDDDDDKIINPKQLAFDFKGILEDYKEARDKEHDIDSIKEVYQDLREWKQNYATLESTDKAKLTAYAKNYAKVEEGLKKIIKADAHIDNHIAKIVELVKQYVAIPDHQSAEAKKIHKDADGVIEQIEKFSKFVGANELLEQCKVLKSILEG
jgi:DNA repair exonuclease SbcCD ATPase subunit